MDFLQGTSPFSPLPSHNPESRRRANPPPENALDYLPGAYHLYNTYYTPYEPYISPVLHFLYRAQAFAYTHIYPYLYPAYHLFARLLSTLFSASPDLAPLILLALVLIISMKLLDMLRRQVLYWISLSLRLAWWAGCGLAGFYVYKRGVVESVEDVTWVIGWASGYLNELEGEGQRVGNARARRKVASAERYQRSGGRGRTR